MMGVALGLKCVVEINLVKVSYHCINGYFHFNIPFKQLYTGVVCVSICVSKCLKEELAWAIDKRLQVISNKIVIPLRNLKNKAV